MSDAAQILREPRLELKITSHPATLADARHAIESFAQACGCDIQICGQIGLCFNEAIANVIRHAYNGATDRPIAITVSRLAGELRIEIRDWGNGINPADLPEEKYNPIAPGGLGMLCLRQLMDEVHFEPQPDGMLMVMTRRLGNTL